MNPYRIEGPAVISFSGGRTSGYMLHEILAAYDGTLPADVVVCFANTGKEAPETLDFARDCAERWSVPIVWLEWRYSFHTEDQWHLVDHASASRNGEPFEQLIARRGYLPGPAARFCSATLKINTIHRYIRATYGWTEWSEAVGFRADEQYRVAGLGNNKTRADRLAPLARAGVTRFDIAAFWESQPFDLALANVDGKTLRGNCDLCFLKNPAAVLSLIREEPSKADWWVAQEEKVAATAPPHARLFRSDWPSYAKLRRMAISHDDLFGYDAIEDCACTD